MNAYPRVSAGTSDPPSTNKTVVDLAFQFGEIVYHVTDEDQRQGIVTGYLLRPSGIVYYVSFGGNETGHFDFELSRDRKVI